MRIEKPLFKYREKNDGRFIDYLLKKDLLYRSQLIVSRPEIYSKIEIENAIKIIELEELNLKEAEDFIQKINYFIQIGDLFSAECLSDMSLPKFPENYTLPILKFKILRLQKKYQETITYIESIINKYMSKDLLLETVSFFDEIGLIEQKNEIVNILKKLS